MNKVVAGLEEAITGIQDGAIIAIPGFFTAGVPRALLGAIAHNRELNNDTN